MSYVWVSCARGGFDLAQPDRIPTLRANAAALPQHIAVSLRLTGKAFSSIRGYASALAKILP